MAFPQPTSRGNRTVAPPPGKRPCVFSSWPKRASADPARSQEVFRVAMSDHASMIVLPSLLASLRRAATHVKVEVSASGGETYEHVAAGRIDTFLCAEEAPPSLDS